MLRRGLHGAKNWALEPEQDGTPRGPGGKTLRVLVVLAPFWVVLSAVTGGPERGGQEIGVGRAIVMAIVVSLAELAWFSARERKEGREEPWLKLPELDTESDKSEAPTLVKPSSEAETVSFEKPQVSEASTVEESCNTVDETVDSEENPRIEPTVVPVAVEKAIFEEPKIQAAEDFEAPPMPLHDPLRQATTDSTKVEDSDPVSSDSDQGVADSFDDEAHEATSSMAYSLVKTPATPLREPVAEAVFKAPFQGETDSTERDEVESCNAEEATGVTVLPEALRETPSATKEVQVEGLKSGVQQPLPMTLASEIAATGPYAVTLDPIAEDWWLVHPDAPEPEPSDAAPEAEPEEISQDVPEESDEAEFPQRGDAVEVGGRRLPPEVVRYLALQSLPSASEQEREMARLEVVRWVRSETDAQRLTQAEAARMLGVNRSTVSRWLDADPWAGAAE